MFVLQMLAAFVLLAYIVAFAIDVNYGLKGGDVVSGCLMVGGFLGAALAAAVFLVMLFPSMR